MSMLLNSSRGFMSTLQKIWEGGIMSIQTKMSRGGGGYCPTPSLVIAKAYNTCS